MWCLRTFDSWKPDATYRVPPRDVHCLTVAARRTHAQRARARAVCRHCRRQSARWRSLERQTSTAGDHVFLGRCQGYCHYLLLSVKRRRLIFPFLFGRLIKVRTFQFILFVLLFIFSAFVNVKSCCVFLFLTWSELCIVVLSMFNSHVFSKCLLCCLVLLSWTLNW